VSPPRRYPTATEQLLALPAESRRAGEMFEVAWSRAVRPDGPLVVTSMRNPPAGVVLWSSDARVRNADRDAIRATNDAWWRAYERTPATARESAVLTLQALLSDLAAAADRAAEAPALSHAAQRHRPARAILMRYITKPPPKRRLTRART
jgi:hypothetical protein